MVVGHITPCWDTQQIKDLQYKADYYQDTELIKKYAQSGHSMAHMTLFNYFEPNPMPEAASQIKKHFDHLANTSIAINKFTPGQYLPVHHDFYGKFKSVHQLDDAANVMRIIIMIEDSVPGQILQVEDTSWCKWVAGDWIAWHNSAKHAFYNFSMVDRYAWQLTGTVDNIC